MRIRITAPVAGILRGVSLSHFAPGFVYDVDASLAGYLIENRAAVEVMSTTPALAEPMEMGDAILTGGVTVEQPRSTAADRAPRRRKGSRPE